MATKSKQKQNLGNLSADELRNQVADSEMRLKRMQFSHAITPIENPMSIRLLRREIARLKTQLSSIQSGR